MINGKDIERELNVAKEKIDLCKINARRFIDAAKCLSAKQMPNICFHLALLAIEELGKIHLVTMKFLAEKRGKEETWIDKHVDSHEKKIYLAILNMSLMKGKIGNKMVANYKLLARKLHAKRLSALYVDTKGCGIKDPVDEVTNEEVEDVMRLAEAMCESQEATILQRPDEETERELEWLREASEDERKKVLIYSEESLEKRASLGDVREWIAWLKSEIEKREENAINALVKEFQRINEKTGEPIKDKWKLRIKVQSDSHDISNKALRYWNDKVDWIKLHPVQRKRSINVEFILSDEIKHNVLDHTGFDIIKGFVTALNIGALGHFWFELSNYRLKYFDSLTDTVTGLELNFKRNDVCIQWPEKTLSNSDMDRALLILSAIFKAHREKKNSPFEHYFAGLSLLSKCDSFLHLTPNSFVCFYYAIKSFVEHFGQENKDIGPGYIVELGKKYYGDPFESDKYEQLFEKVEKGSMNIVRVSFDDVALVKLICDIHFIESLDKYLRKK